MIPYEFYSICVLLFYVCNVIGTVGVNKPAVPAYKRFCVMEHRTNIIQFARVGTAADKDFDVMPLNRQSILVSRPHLPNLLYPPPLSCLPYTWPDKHILPLLEARNREYVNMIGVVNR